ncbi:extracellular solute-binding protein [Paenibacillus sp. GCM10023252]|uniref:extracellular solute-binding protein n=1 Tax=Paenibacillus sp. GCM10023252 TaxID=3252649 RepID=UPI0036104535
MNKVKKWMVVTLALSMTAMAACSTGNEKNTVEPAASKAPPAEASKDPVKFTFWTTDGNQAVPGGNLMEDPTIKYLAEKTNTIPEITFLPHGQLDNQKRVKFASGELPDVSMDFGVNGDLFRNNQLIALDEYIEQYGPNLKKEIPQEAWDAVKRNGKIYAIPTVQYGNIPVNRIMYVRKDWMNKVGITENPKTSDEFLAMLRAFRDKDPNGNGQKDEIAFSAREQFTWLDNVLGMFGTSVFGGVPVDGQLVPRNTTQEMKNALGFVKQLYDEKLLDSEFMTNKRNTWEQKILSDKVGVWVHAPNLAWDWQDKLNKAYPGKELEVIAIPTPKAPGVTESGFIKTPFNQAFNITKNAKDPAAIVKFFDWLVSEEGQEFVSFGIPGVTYTKENGKITYNAQKDADDKTDLWRKGTFTILGWNEELEKVKLGEKAVAKLKEVYAVGNADGMTNYTLGIPPFKAAQPEIGEFGTAGTMFVETAGRIVMGDQPLEYFDEYVATWKKQGGDDLIKQATEWYNTNNKK